MAEGDISTEELRMNPADLCREDLYTDRKMGTIRVLTPVDGNGDTDPSRAVSYLGQTQIMTPMGSLPISFEIEADSLAAAVEGYAPAAQVAIEEAVEEIKEMRRQQASSIVVPEMGGGGAPGGMPGGGKIQIP